jgi:hypothetical protein
MVLDRLEDKRSALRIALRNERVLDCRNLLKAIYDTDMRCRSASIRLRNPTGESGFAT